MHAFQFSRWAMQIHGEWHQMQIQTKDKTKGPHIEQQLCQTDDAIVCIIMGDGRMGTPTMLPGGIDMPSSPPPPIIPSLGPPCSLSNTLKNESRSCFSSNLRWCTGKRRQEMLLLYMELLCAVQPIFYSLVLLVVFQVASHLRLCKLWLNYGIFKVLIEWYKLMSLNYKWKNHLVIFFGTLFALKTTRRRTHLPWGNEQKYHISAISSGGERERESVSCFWTIACSLSSCPAQLGLIKSHRCVSAGKEPRQRGSSSVAWTPCSSKALAFFLSDLDSKG